LDPWARTVVSATETQITRPLPQVDSRPDLPHLGPWNARRTPSREAGCDSAQATAPTPRGGTDQDGGNVQLLCDVPLELQVVDLAAATLLDIQQLVVEHSERKVDRPS
jgi:hypothetical protein